MLRRFRWPLENTFSSLPISFKAAAFSQHAPWPRPCGSRGPAAPVGPQPHAGLQHAPCSAGWWQTQEKNITRHAEQRAHGLWHVIVADCPSFLGQSFTVHQYRSTDSSLMPVISPAGSQGQIAGSGYYKCTLHVSPLGHSLEPACSFLEFEVIYKAAKLSDPSVCCAPCTYRSARWGNLKGLTTLTDSQHAPAQHRHEQDGPTCFQRHSTRTMKEHGSPGTIIASHGPGEQPRDSLWQTRWNKQCRAGIRCRPRWKPDPPRPCRWPLGRMGTPVMPSPRLCPLYHTANAQLEQVAINYKSSGGSFPSIYSSMMIHKRFESSTVDNLSLSANSTRSIVFNHFLQMKSNFYYLPFKAN